MVFRQLISSQNSPFAIKKRRVLLSRLDVLVFLREARGPKNASSFVVVVVVAPHINVRGKLKSYVMRSAQCHQRERARFMPARAVRNFRAP